MRPCASSTSTSAGPAAVAGPTSKRDAAAAPTRLRSMAPENRRVTELLTELVPWPSNGRKAVPDDAGSDSGAAAGARGARGAGRPPPGLRLPAGLRALPQAPGRGLPKRHRAAALHRLRDRRDGVRAREPDRARRSRGCRLSRLVRRALARHRAQVRLRRRALAPLRVGRDAVRRRPRGPARAGRRRQTRPADALGDVDRRRRRRRVARRGRGRGGSAGRGRRGLEPRRDPARDGRVGARRRRLGLAEGADDAARAGLRRPLAARGASGGPAELLLRLDPDPQGAGQARLGVHARGLARPGARGRARAAPRRRPRGGVRPAPPARPGLPRGRQGAGARALLARRRLLGRRHRGADAGRVRQRRPRARAAGPLRDHDRQRPGRAQGKDLPHRPHRLLRRLRRHDGARGDRGDARRPRRPDRARRRRDPRARGVRGRGARVTDPRPRILVCEPIAEAGVELLRERFDVDVEPNGDLAERIGGYDAVVVRSATKLTAEVLEHAERLRVIGRAGVGVDNVDVEAATRRGIVVANAPESNVVSAAEHTIGLLVALARNIPQAHAALKQGRWERSAHGGVELEGKTLAVLGFGRIGQQVARRALGLGMRLAASTAEAQDRAGVVVAEQVAAALEGALVTHAVNIPSIGAEDLDVLGPYVPLAANLGRLAMELAGGRAEAIELTYYGGLADFDTRLLSVAALNGAFQGRVDGPVNYVNAPLVAAERGIDVRERRQSSSRDFTNLVRVGVAAEGEEVRVAGTTIGRDHRRWLLSALRFEVELELAPLLVFFPYDDLPGVIGRVGTLFGEAGVNIANMAVSRTRRGGKALMALSIDSEAPSELVERVHTEGFDDARFISLG